MSGRDQLGDEVRLVLDPTGLTGLRTGLLRVGHDHAGAPVVREGERAVVAEEVSVSATGRLSVRAQVLGPHRDLRLAVAATGRREEGPASRARAGLIDLDLDLKSSGTRFGPLPLPSGHHDLWVVLPDNSVEPLLVGDHLEGALPLAFGTAQVEGRVVSGPRGIVRITLRRPLGSARGAFHQRRLREAARGGGPVAGVLFAAEDPARALPDALSVHRALRRTGSDLPTHWAVRDHSVPVPEDGERVVVNTARYHELVQRAAFYVSDAAAPPERPHGSGRVVVRTTSRYPHPGPGHPGSGHGEPTPSTAAAPQSERWHYLVSPSGPATEQLGRQLGEPLHGVLEIGSPRLDVLNSPEATDLREEVRAAWGIRADQIAVLYSPAAGGSGEPFRDVDQLSRSLEGRYVLLVPGMEPAVAGRRGSGARWLGLAGYPEPADLLLAADAAVLGDPALAFDVAVTGRPILFAGGNGFEQWFGGEAPGPVVQTAGEVAAGLGDLDGLRSRHESAYEQFRRAHLYLEDGSAGRRFVTAIFSTRIDA